MTRNQSTAAWLGIAAATVAGVAIGHTWRADAPYVAGECVVDRETMEHYCPTPVPDISCRQPTGHASWVCFER